MYMQINLENEEEKNPSESPVNICIHNVDHVDANKIFTRITRIDVPCRILLKVKMKQHYLDDVFRLKS